MLMQESPHPTGVQIHPMNALMSDANNRASALHPIPSYPLKEGALSSTTVWLSDALM